VKPIHLHGREPGISFPTLPCTCERMRQLQDRHYSRCICRPLRGQLDPHSSPANEGFVGDSWAFESFNGSAEQFLVDRRSQRALHFTPPACHLTLWALASARTRQGPSFGKISTDREVLNGDQTRSHKKSDSFRRDDTRQTASPNSMAKPYEVS
jgi:hypothetical protein